MKLNRMITLCAMASALADMHQAIKNPAAFTEADIDYAADRVASDHGRDRRPDVQGVHDYAPLTV